MRACASRRLSSMLAGLILIVLLAPAGLPLQAQERDGAVEAILAQMGPEERVGQLFLITFFGADAGTESDIAVLVSEYHVGGVMLSARNGNFASDDGLVEQVYALTSGLQRLAAGQTVGVESGVATATPQPPSSPLYVPLFIGIEYEGSSAAYTQLHSGVTPLPSSMALGATWDPALAEATGAVVGQELSALGFNLLIGPSADVMEVPQPFAAGDLGTRVFGGEPFWVSRMTAAYVRGVHQGSSGRIAVIPRHFPGYGGADRLANVEIPTVRRSLDQLTQSDLKPFFAVTGAASNPLEIADGLLVGHIRYQGFQGDNPRLATRPISLDTAALPVLLGLQPIATWRQAGGLMISDALGLRGVRRFYDPDERVFAGRLIALDAFNAGNDMLYLGDFGTDPAANQTAAVVDTIKFFVQRYQDDPAFQTQVDSAVRRIIGKKLDLYGTFDLAAVVPDEAGLAGLGGQSEQMYEVARQAVTLLSPAQAELLESPQRGENILIFTDTRIVSQCETCTPHALIPVDAMRAAILRSYGPEAAGVVSLASVYSQSFEDLVDYLDAGALPPTAVATETPEPDRLGFLLDTADWVVFLMLDVTPDVPASYAVKRFLADPPVAADTRVVVMAMGAPYYLDSTEISKLTAYYALYGYTNPFVDIAARALFEGVAPLGASPVSISGVNYDILRATSPDPAQVITLSTAVERAVGEETPVPTPEELVVGQGDTLRITTGVIIDRNGHAVPDGTPVEFVLTFNDGTRDTQPVTTSGGVAQTSIVLTRPGELRITVTSGEARSSDTVRLAIPDTGRAPIDILPPDITPTAIPVPTSTPEPEPSPIPEPTPRPSVAVEPVPAMPNVTFGSLFLTVLGLAIIGLAVFILGFLGHDLNHALFLALPVLLVGLLCYNYYALMLPGSALWRSMFGDMWSPAVAAWFGGVLGFGLAQAASYVWDRGIVPSRGRKRR